jgi:hypothetical protein
MVAANLLQIALWGALFLWLGEFEEAFDAMYHSAVNFSSLGYGDIVMSANRKLLGPLEAVNGVLMLGMTAAAVMAIVQHLIKSYREPPWPAGSMVRRSIASGSFRRAHRSMQMTDSRSGYWSGQSGAGAAILPYRARLWQPSSPAAPGRQGRESRMQAGGTLGQSTSGGRTTGNPIASGQARDKADGRQKADIKY